MGASERSTAEQIVGDYWDDNRVEDEFATFINWHKQNKPRSHDWTAAWETWCRRGRQFAERDAKKDKPTGLESALIGLKRWRDKQPLH